MGSSSRGCCGLVAGAAGFSLVQALVWLALAVVAVLLLNCSIEPSDTSPTYSIALVYFFNSECVPGNYSQLLENDVSETTTKRTEAIVWYFLVTSALRIVTACALLVTLARRASGGRVGVVFWLWAGLALACLLGDLVCAIFYAVDMGDEDIKNLLEKVNFTDHWTTPEVPLSLFLLCFRFGILWIVETCLVAASIRTTMKERHQLPQPSHKNTPQRVPGHATPSGDAGGSKRQTDSPDSVLYYDVRGPTDGQQWNGARPKEPNWRDSAGRPPDRWNGAGGSGSATPDRWSHNDEPGSSGRGTPDRWTGGDGGRGGPNIPRAGHGVPPSPRDSHPEYREPERRAPWGPRPPDGAADPSAFRPPSHNSNGPPGDAEPYPPGMEGERRYVEKLKDHEAERRRREDAKAAKEEKRRRRQEEMEEEARRMRDEALQEVSRKAEERRRRQAEAKAEAALKTAPPVPPKPTPVELQNQKPWSYVLPPLHKLFGKREERPPPDSDSDDDNGDDVQPKDPEIDYTLHITRNNNRPALDTS